MLELVYRATADVVAPDPVTGVMTVIAVPGDILTPEQVNAAGLDAPRRLRTTDATPQQRRRGSEGR